jgi:nucleotide-binding universal stress UspA family protein
MAPYRRIVHATDFSSSALPALQQASAILAEGLPAEEVLRTARRQRADLLVLGTHGRTGLRRALMGSVAERVVSRARCPVLTVRS